MSPTKVVTAQELEETLREAGYTPTDECTETGRFWRSPTGEHIQVPHPYMDDMYPEFILKDLRVRIPVLMRNPFA